MKQLLFLLAVLITASTFAQDTIVRRDSAKIVAKVLTVDSKTITYQRYNSSESPVYSIGVSEVARIAYHDGYSEKFGKRSTTEIQLKKNSVGVTITDAVAGMLTLNYERIFWNDFGVRVQASRGLLASQYPKSGSYFYQATYYYSRFKPLSVTLNMHYYARKTSNLSYCVGAAMEYGQSQQCGYWGGCFPSPSEPRIVEYYMAGLTNGVAIKTNGPISLDLYTTLGFMRESTYDDFQPAARFGFNVGYRF